MLVAEWLLTMLIAIYQSPILSETSVSIPQLEKPKTE